MAERIQRKRSKGWRKPPGAVAVDRTTKWGNPYLLVSYPTGMPREMARRHALDSYRKLVLGQLEVSLHTVPFTVDDVRRELRGKDLMCWCPIASPCHADVLLEVANG